MPHRARIGSKASFGIQQGRNAVLMPTGITTSNRAVDHLQNKHFNFEDHDAEQLRT
jgi:hypothetical protein